MKSRRFLSKLRNSLRSTKAKSRKRGHVAPLQDLGLFEDKVDSRFFESIGRKATARAIKENIALGIPQTYWRDGKVIRTMPDGTVQIIHGVVCGSIKKGRQLKKGTVIHVKK